MWGLILTTILSDPGMQTWPVGSMPKFTYPAANEANVYVVSDGKTCFKGNNRMSNAEFFDDAKTVASFCRPWCRVRKPLAILKCAIHWHIRDSGELEMDYDICKKHISFNDFKNWKVTYDFDNEDNLCRNIK